MSHPGPGPEAPHKRACWYLTSGCQPELNSCHAGPGTAAVAGRKHQRPNVPGRPAGSQLRLARVLITVGPGRARAPGGVSASSSRRQWARWQRLRADSGDSASLSQPEPESEFNLKLDCTPSRQG
jgi:hypothetical protein